MGKKTARRAPRASARTADDETMRTADDGDDSAEEDHEEHDRMHGDRFKAAEPALEEPLEPKAMLWETMAEQQRELHEEEVSVVCAKLRQAVAMRDQYCPPTDRDEWSLPRTADGSVEPSAHGSPDYDPFTPPKISCKKRYHFEMRSGVTYVWDAPPTPAAGAGAAGGAADNPFGALAEEEEEFSLDDCAFEPPLPYEKYSRDLGRLMRICADAAVNSFSWRRLQRLESRFKLHVSYKTNRRIYTANL